MWKDKQRENIAFIEEAFGGLPLLKAPLFGGEVSGIEAGAEVVTKGAFLLKSDVLRSKMGAGCAD